MRLDRIADTSTVTLSRASDSLFSCKLQITVARGLHVKYTRQTRKMAAAQRDAELECTCKYVTVFSPHKWTWVVCSTFRWVDSDLDKDVGNTQLHRIQFIQQLRSVLFWGCLQFHWGKMRAACKQTNVNMTDVEQFSDTKCRSGPILGRYSPRRKT